MAERWVLATLLLAAVAVVFGNGWGRFFSDAQPDLYLAPGRVLRNALSAWLPSPYVGAPNYQSGLAPAAAVSAALSWLGVAPWVIMRLIRIALLIVAGAGARALYRDVFDSESVVGRTAAAVLFVANPYVVVTAASLAVMQPLAALPWLMLFLSRALRGQRTSWNLALVTLVFFAMGGENAGVVPVLLFGACLPALAVDALLLRRVPVRLVALRALGCLASIAAVSAYWILPSLSAVGAGSAVAAGTETPAIIYATSSYAEVLRGLGGWPLYGQDGSGPFEPEFVLYISQPAVVLATFTLCLLALAGALHGTRRRLVPVVMVLTGVVVSAGAFPLNGSSWYGWLWLWAQVHIPGVIALRTGVKAGGVVLLGLSLLGALAVTRLVAGASHRERTSTRVASWLIGALACVGFVVSVLPMVNGRLFDRSFIIPSYWYAAAARLDQGDQSARVLVLPGQKLFSYRWRRPSADDPLAGLTGRLLVLPTTASTSTPPAVNFLAALDQPLERGTQRPTAVSAMARYLAADEVVLRSDIIWETSDGARPASLLRQLGFDSGLVPDGAYGVPGLNTSGRIPVPPSADIATESTMAPVQMYRVQAPDPLVQSVPASGALLVVGDNTAVPSLVDLGMLDGSRPFFLAGSLTSGDVGDALSAASAIVLTDANQRRVVNTSRLANGYGPLLSADTALGATDALFGAADQTVLQMSGADRVSATSSGSIFGPVPFGSPRLAFDGDVSSGWTVGDFGRAVGQSITVDYSQPETVSSVRILALASAPVALKSVDITVAGEHHRVDIRADGAGVVTFEPTATRSVTVTITATSGTGDNAVGIAEIQVGGAAVIPYERLPLTLDRLATTVAGQTRLAALPLDVLLQRDRGLNLEGRLLRMFDLPDPRAFDTTADAAMSRSLADPLVDRLVGTAGSIVTSSGRLLGDPILRGSQAFDANPSTSWVAIGTNPWVMATFTPRPVDSVTVTPAVGNVDGVTLTAPRSVRLTFSDGTSVERRLGPGSTKLTFPERQTRSLRVTLLSTGGLAAGLASVTPGVGPALITPDGLPLGRRCVDIVTIDGKAVPMRTTATSVQLLSGAVVPFVNCASPVQLGYGQHTLSTGPDWLIDRVLLAAPSDIVTSPTATPPPSPPVTVLASAATRFDLQIGPSRADSILVVGQPFDLRWHATLDGSDLGTPMLLDGYALGWRIPAGDGGVVAVTYAPQRTLVTGLVVTCLTLMGALGLLASRRRGRPENSEIRDQVGPLVKRSRRRRAVELSVVAFAVFIFAGPVVLFITAATAVVVAPWVSGWATRAGVAGVILVSLGPVAYVAGNHARLGQVTPDLISGNLLPHFLTGAGLALVGVAVLADVTGGRAWRGGFGAERETPLERGEG